MSGVLIVDWLGRGGIAQTAAEWRRTLEPYGDVRVVTRAGLELASDGPHVGVARPRVGGRYAWHLAVVRAAITAIDRFCPDVVVIHNYLVPTMESAVLRRARRRGARTVLVVHNRQPHQRTAGLRSGLERHLLTADVLVAHSEFVATDLPRVDRVRTIPLPRPNMLLAEGRPGAAMPDRPLPTLIQFGVMGRRYKGSEVLDSLALMEDFGWRFRLVGAMATTAARHSPRMSLRSGFLSGGDLVSEILSASAVALPYRAASQSAALVLGQALGRPPIATAVGGLPEQIDNGVDGILMAPDADPQAWRTTLVGLTPAIRNDLGMSGVRRVDSAHALFEAGVVEVCLGTVTRS